MRIRNPWGDLIVLSFKRKKIILKLWLYIKGNDVEWNGSWSDNSREWNSISESEKSEIGLVNEKDGEFW